MSKPAKYLYEFGPFRLDPLERLLLRRDGQAVPLTPKVFDVLLVLVRNSGHLMERDELLKAVWADSFVEEGNLTFSISSLRKALGEGHNGEKYIETVPRRGYRFVANVRTFEEETNAAPGDEQEGARRVETQEQEEEEAKRVGQDESLSPGEAAKGWQNNARAATSLDVGEAPRREFDDGNWTRIIKRHGAVSAAVAAGLLCIVLGLAWLAYWRLFRKPAQPFQLASVTRLTTGRNVVNAAISPDGKYVVYAVNEAGQQSLWVRQIATNSHAQIAAPAEVSYLWLDFSKDGNYILYQMAVGDNMPALYQIPVLGGAARKLLEECKGPLALSPDGRQFAFIRRSSGGEIALMVANAFDGSGERRLAFRQSQGFLSGPAWSPDGKSIACIAGSTNDEGRQSGLTIVRVADGAEETVASGRWNFIRQVTWVADGSSLLATTSEEPYGPYQIWLVSYPDGAVRRVTNDLNNYGYVSLTADSGMLVTVLHDIHPIVWVAPKDDSSQAKQITFGPGTANDYWGFSWTPDGRILYGSIASGHQEIWSMNADGSQQKQLTADGHSNFDPSVSPDGREVVFSSDRTGSRKIWRMDIDGNGLKQLTSGGSEDFLPAYSPDGQWVVYTSGNGRKLTVWKVSAKGGEPIELTEKISGWPTVSPDGKLVACWHANDAAGKMGLAVIPFNGGQPVKLFDISPTVNIWGEVRWTTDSRALTYIDRRGDVCNIWLQPLAGGPPRQLTEFKSDQIYRFDWSRDGQQLVCSRGVESNDVVLLSSSK